MSPCLQAIIERHGEGCVLRAMREFAKARLCEVYSSRAGELRTYERAEPWERICAEIDAL